MLVRRIAGPRRVFRPIRNDKVFGACVATVVVALIRSQNVPQGLKPSPSGGSIAALKALRHPKSTADVSYSCPRPWKSLSIAKNYTIGRMCWQAKQLYSERICRNHL